MTSTVITDNIIDVLLGDETDAYFVHQVNCKKVAGSGLAAQFRKRVPRWFDTYKRTEAQLGDIGLFRVNDNVIVNLYGQDGFGYNRQYTDYEAVGKGLIQLSEMLEPGTKVYFPYKMGAGLGGGNWELIQSIIEAALQDQEIIYVRKQL